VWTSLTFHVLKRLREMMPREEKRGLLVMLAVSVLLANDGAKASVRVPPPPSDRHAGPVVDPARSTRRATRPVETDSGRHTVNTNTAAAVLRLTSTASSALRQVRKCAAE